MFQSLSFLRNLSLEWTKFSQNFGIWNILKTDKSVYKKYQFQYIGPKDLWVHSQFSDLFTTNSFKQLQISTAEKTIPRSLKKIACGNVLKLKASTTTQISAKSNKRNTTITKQKYIQIKKT